MRCKSSKSTFFWRDGHEPKQRNKQKRNASRYVLKTSFNGTAASLIVPRQHLTHYNLERQGKFYDSRIR